MSGTDWKKWAGEAVSARADAQPKDSGGSGRPERWKAMQAELEAVLKADPLCFGFNPDARWQAALEKAASVADSEAALAALAQRLTVRYPGGRDIWDAWADPCGVPVLRGMGLNGSVLRRGEVAVLSGAGGRGKSTLALQWALAAAVGEAVGQEWTPAGGLQVRAGRTVILSYEDDARDIADRASKALALPSLAEPLTDIQPREAAGGRIEVHSMRGWPLFGVGAGEHHASRPEPLEAWEPVWHCIRAYGAHLVIIDPAMSAYLASGNAVEFVRLFMDSLIEEARKADCGLLVIAHSTKAARRSKDADETGNVSGSAAWTDAARGVLVLGPGSNPTQRKLSCEKANHSRQFERLLAEHTRQSGGMQWPEFLGFEDGGAWTSRTEPAPTGNGRAKGEPNGPPEGIKDMFPV